MKTKEEILDQVNFFITPEKKQQIFVAMEEYATQCQEDSKDKKYTKEDMRRAYNKGNNTARAEYEKVVPEYIKPMEFEDFIKLLNNEK